MTTSITYCLFFLSLLSLVITFGHSNPNIIDETCRTCSEEDPNVNFDFCCTSLKSVPTNESLSVYGLGKTSMKLLECNITDSRSRFKELFSKELDPNMKKRLADCFELYDNALPSVKRAMELYKLKQFFEANFKVTSAMDASSACQDGFKEIGRYYPEVAKRNSDAFELGAMVLSIMHMIQFR